MADVTAEVGGNVWKVLVKPGQSVAEGDTLVILECMKMEVPVVAPVAGTVTEIHVAEGGAVEEGGPTRRSPRASAIPRKAATVFRPKLRENKDLEGKRSIHRSGDPLKNILLLLILRSSRSEPRRARFRLRQIRWAVYLPVGAVC